MANSKRNEMAAPAAYRLPEPPLPDGPWSGTASTPGYRPGGQVGQMQLDLAQRLAGSFAADVAVSREERVVRFLSVAGGLVALAAGYAGVALLILR